MGMAMAVSVAGDRARFEELYAAQSADALRVAFLLVGDSFHAEDIVQEAFVRVLGRFGDVRKPDALRTYLLRTVVNLSKNHFRRRALEVRHLHDTDALTGLPSLSAPESRQDLLTALRRLPERQRAAVVLRYCEDFSLQQTADVLGTSAKAIKSLVTRGLKSLREARDVLG